ncbi:MAG TPA: PDZ domain-containing protein [Bacillota bacterium]|nr:PDZ domain-containing protein [Bacillota bacterium]
MDISLIEILKVIINIFLQPLLYWSIICLFLTSYFRMKRERLHFGVKIFPSFAESKGTWKVSIIFGMIYSILFLSIGFVFTYELTILLAIVTVILSITGRTSLLSPSYTIGITFLLIVISPVVLQEQSSVDPHLFATISLPMISLLIGLFLVVEAFFVSRVKRTDVYPNLSKSNRGVWIGKHDIKKATVIPFIGLIPGDLISPFANYWPHFSMGEETYTFIVIPLLLGFNFSVQSQSIERATAYLGKKLLLLASFTLVIALGSLYEERLAFVAVIVAIIGREYITYIFKQLDKSHIASFNKLNQGLKVLAVMPESSADRLGILVGESITKVNDVRINHPDEFYEQLRQSGASFKLEVIDDNDEIRFIQHARFENDHHSLGIIFTQEPRRIVKPSLVNES